LVDVLLTWGTGGVTAWSWNGAEWTSHGADANAPLQAVDATIGWHADAGRLVLVQRQSPSFGPGSVALQASLGEQCDDRNTVNGDAIVPEQLSVVVGAPAMVAAHWPVTSARTGMIGATVSSTTIRC
jgi:cysteine-rich repeat protein